MTSRLVKTEFDRKLLIRFIGVPGYEGAYEINLLGQVRSIARFVRSPICGGLRLLPARPMRVFLRGGYPSFIACVEGKAKFIRIHRALAILHIPNPDGKPHINHIDGDKANFDLSNLEWCTHLENMQHAYRTGLVTPRKLGKGELSPASKLNDETVRQIKRRLASGETQSKIALSYGVKKGTIGFIARGETWSHILP